MASESKDPILYIWSAQWGLPSSEPICLATLMYLQRILPGKFSVMPCNNPDLSPTGQLPFLVHEQQVLAGLRPIVKYALDLASKSQNTAPPLPSLVPTEKAQQVAWLAHAESHLGDLVYYSLFSHLENWYEFTHPTFVSLFPVPHRYYMPGRIRESYRPRLEAAGLWNVHKDEAKEKSLFKPKSKLEEKAKHAETIHQAFGREKVLEKAKESFEVYADLLGDKPFVFEKGPSIADIVIAAHVLLLSTPKYPDTAIQTLLKTYSSLVAHSQRVLSATVTGASEPIRIIDERPPFLQSLIPRMTITKKSVEKPNPEDAHFARMRWGFLGLTLGSLAVYLLMNANLLKARAAAAQQHVGEEQEE